MPRSNWDRSRRRPNHWTLPCGPARPRSRSCRHHAACCWRGPGNRTLPGSSSTPPSRRCRHAGLDAAVVIATHTLGLVRWVSGDLPGALQAMSTADEVRPEVRSGIRALDRAKVLLAAGLLAEAREFTDRAEQVFTAEHSKVDLADSLLVQAEIDLVARQSRTARSAARRAARSYAAAGHQRGLLAARVMQARAGSIVRSSIRPLPHDRARQDAKRAG